MLGIIGGTGLYEIDGLKVIDRRVIDTPFGRPSAPLTIAELDGKKLVFLPRHGEGHGLIPSEINFRANIFALKLSGVTHIISVSAVGSLQAEIRPGDLALPNQYVDWTRGRRDSSFFGKGLVAHIASANPVSAKLEEVIAAGYRSAPGLADTVPLHRHKTYVCVEGPRLGTRAESDMFRKLGFDLVGMTNVPEAFLALEAQISYATIAVPTDYDSWLDDPSQHVSVEKVIELFMSRVGVVKNLLKHVAVNAVLPADCPARTSLASAILTSEKALTDEHRSILSVLRS